jgi:hypothetical protein
LAPDTVNFTNQVHDFDPGIHPYPEGLFWTVAVESDAVDADLEDGTASIEVSHLSVRDFFNIPNGLFRNNHPGLPESMAATVSYDLDWMGPVSRRFSLVDNTHHFRGRFIENQARMEWSAHREDGFKFESDSASTSHSTFSEVGRVQNGVFFDEDAGED